MAFRSTKAMAQKTTAAPLKYTAQAQSIDPHLPESASTCAPKKYLYNKKNRGHEAELMAAQHLEKLGYRVLWKNLKTLYAEVDLLLESGAGNFVLCEVKLWTHYDGGLSSPLSERQLQRLRRALLHLQSGASQPVESLLVTVSNLKSGRPSFQMFKNFL